MHGELKRMMKATIILDERCCWVLRLVKDGTGVETRGTTLEPIKQFGLGRVTLTICCLLEHPTVM